MPAPLYELRVSMLRFFRVSKEAAMKVTAVVKHQWCDGRMAAQRSEVKENESFGCLMFECKAHPFDGSEILRQLIRKIYPIVYKISYIQGCAGFLPSTAVRTLPILSSIHHIVHPDGISTLVFFYQRTSYTC